ncbi:ribonuclease H-like domain-containing protein [Tanacetum coccineum]
MQFLIGLDDFYMQIRRSILSREVLPDVRSAYATISSEESHRVAAGSIASSSQRNQAFAFMSTMPNRNNFQRNQTSGFTQRNQASDSSQNLNSGPRPNNLNNNRKSGGSGLVCENCGFNGHTIDRCFNIIGYPADLKKKKSNQSFKEKNISNNNSVGSGSSSGFTDEQMATLISLIKDNQVGKKVHANMADFEVEKNDSANIFQDIKHINFFDIEYPEMPNDDERVANDLNKGESNSCSSYVSSSNINTADSPVDYGNDADSSNELVTTHNEEVAILEENIFSKGNLDQNPSSSQGVQNTDAMNQEMDALLRNDTWVIVELPEGRKAIGSKWIYKIKFKSSGEIDKYKARLVGQSFGQKEGIDYEETFSLVVRMVTVRCLLNIAMSMSWYVFKLDVNNAFLYGDLEEVVYIKPPEGYFLSDNKRKYVLALLSEYGMLACKPTKTPFMSNLVISNEASDKFMHSPLTSHLNIAFKILRYLKSCPGLRIHITKTLKQNTLSKSSTEAAYRALTSVTSEVIWIFKILKDLQIENLLRVSLHCDNNSAIKIAANPVFHERTKHLEIDLHFVR